MKKDSTSEIQAQLQKSVELLEVFKEKNRINDYFKSDMDMITKEILSQSSCYITSYALTLNFEDADGYGTKLQVFNARDLDALLGKLELLKASVLELAKSDLTDIPQLVPDQSVDSEPVSQPEVVSDTTELKEVFKQGPVEELKKKLDIKDICKKLGINNKKDDE